MLNHTQMASMDDFFGMLWKEYALSDSRYMFSDSFVLCMETWTMVWNQLQSRYNIVTHEFVDNLGTTIICDGNSHRERLAISTSDPSLSLYRTILWGYALLSYKSFR